MPERRPDVIEVVMFAADAHALLRRRRALVVASLLPQEQVLELIHPGVGEEQRGVVVGHERSAGDDAMPVPLEVLQERRANLLGGHWFYCSGGNGGDGGNGDHTEQRRSGVSKGSSPFLRSSV